MDRARRPFITKIRRCLWFMPAIFGLLLLTPPVAFATLEEELLGEDTEALAKAAVASGDPLRGAVLFHQPYLSCTKCHAGQEGKQPVGPNLSELRPKPTDSDLVDALLRPSKVIRDGYSTYSALLTDGEVVHGLLLEQNEEWVRLRDAAKNYDEVRIANDRIEQLTRSEVSTMPSGQVNALTSRQQFLDLVRYLMEIRDGGEARARELEPPANLLGNLPLPEYEANIDHAGMIQSMDDAAKKRGRAIYQRVCANCHGTRDQLGSLPTSLRFASGQFKNGSDPYAMYQTLTRGFGLMVPQTWMVPQQKYDVIHYIREEYLQSDNPTQYFPIDETYLARLPKGSSRGPEPSKILAWQQMDYGPSLIGTYEIGDDGSNFAYKGNAVRLDPGHGGVSHGKAWSIFDSDTLRLAAVWTGDQFIDYRGIVFDGQHAVHPRVQGTVQFANSTGPGWARPGTESFDDDRLLGRDGRRYGPLPRDWARYRGMYSHGDKTIVAYDVGSTAVLELQRQVENPNFVFARQFRIGPRSEAMLLQVMEDKRGPDLVQPIDVPPTGTVFRNVIVWECPAASTAADRPRSPSKRKRKPGDEEDSRPVAFAAGPVIAGLASDPAVDLSGLEWTVSDGRLRLRIAAGDRPLSFTLWMTRLHDAQRPSEFLSTLSIADPSLDLASLTHGGPKRWPEPVTTTIVKGNQQGPFAVDVLTYPLVNPWHCRMRLTGHDFFTDGDKAAVCDWDGNVWLVSGLLGGHRLKSDPGEDVPYSRDARLNWRRIASGLFQPLGIRIIDDVIHVTCRDQLCRLHDLNGDDAIDWYECINNDHQVTDHFHEFAMGLQTDADGNFYYAKSARHALPAVVPQHGTLLRVSKDGTRTEILATGFRAANGVCLNPDGTFVVTDQEGHWNPKNRINWVRPGGFYGNMYGFHDVTDTSDLAMEPPLCWITNSFDRSPAELLWVTSKRWGPLDGVLLNLSYGYGEVYLVLREEVGGQMQGGMVELPIEAFPTGIIRGRFHPGDGQLYLTGMYSWAGSRQEPGGFFRVRYTGKPLHLPVELTTAQDGLVLRFSDDLDPIAAERPESYRIKVWDIRRTKEYGSEHFDEHEIPVSKASVSGRTVHLEIPSIAPTRCMEIRYHLKSSDRADVTGVIHNTIHRLAGKQ